MIKKVDGKWMLTDGFYAFGKKFVQVYLPALASLYFGLGKLWGFPAIEQVVGSCAVIATFIGVTLGISSSNFDKTDAGYDGNVVVTTHPQTGKKLYSLEINHDAVSIDHLDQKSSLKFKMAPRD